MHKIKAVLRLIYVPIFIFYRRVNFFWLPNLLSKTNTSINSGVEFQQLTLIRGLGKIEIGKNCCFGAFRGGFHRNGSIELQTRDKEAQILIGDGVKTNNNVFICSANLISIGEKTLIGQGVTIMDFEAHCKDPNKRDLVGEIGSIKIGKNVWIGNNVIILKNSVIGDNTIIAAGAVVAGTFDENSIIGGIPAKFLKSI